MVTEWCSSLLLRKDAVVVKKLLKAQVLPQKKLQDNFNLNY